MISVTKKVNLPSIQAVNDLLTKDLPLNIGKSANVIRVEVLKRWQAQKGADNTPFKPISKEYAKIKVERPVIDMLKEGNMTQDWGIKEQGKDYARLGFSGKELEKARANYNRRPNMLRVDKSLAKIARDFFNELIKKKI